MVTMTTDIVPIYILSHRRPDNVLTIDDALRHSTWTAPVYIVVDDEDPTIDEYRANYGTDRAVVFSKQDTLARMDIGDNFGLSGSCVPRAAIWDIARNHGHRYFLMLDDDYRYFDWRFDSDGRPVYGRQEMVRNLDAVVAALVDWYKKFPPQIVTVAIMQLGEMIGGFANSIVDAIKVKRKAMNFFICDTEREFEFPGRLNEDVNAYTEIQRRGYPMMTINNVALWPTPTQRNDGGLTDDYLDQGTYTKSMYSVIRCPSAVKVSMLDDRGVNPRIHHKVNYKHVAPEIIPERYRKAQP